MRILVADDERDIREMLAVVLAAESWAVEQAADGEEALESVRRRPPDVLILDHKMPRMTGLEVARLLLEEGFAGPILLFSAYLDGAMLEQCAELGVGAVDKLDWPQLVEACRRVEGARSA